jgi:hypothetical protein
MLKPVGFWSYSSTDDKFSHGRLSVLRALLAAELQLKIGRTPINIFQDVASIPAGSQWETEVHDALEGSSFFIPIVTPALLQSEWCCKEIRLFREREKATLRRNDMIFPLHYLSTDALNVSFSADVFDPDVFTLLRSRQWIDFRTFRLSDPNSEDVARKLDEVTNNIYSALRRDQHISEENAEQSRPQISPRRAGSKQRVKIIDQIINEFLQPIKSRLEKDNAIWRAILSKEKSDPSSREYKIANYVEHVFVLPNHDEIMSIIGKYRHLVYDDKELGGVLNDYLKHIVMYKSIRESGDELTFPDKVGAPWPRSFYPMIDQRLNALNAERASLVNDAPE